jgi:hypothetical protein
MINETLQNYSIKLNIYIWNFFKGNLVLLHIMISLVRSKRAYKYLLISMILNLHNIGKTIISEL